MEGLRRATPDDAVAAKSLAVSAYEHYVDEIGGPAGPMVWDYGELIERVETWVLPGDAGLDALIMLDLKDGALWVENVCVRPACQGGGIGRALLEHAEVRATEKGAGELRLFTHQGMTDNQAIYTRLGWAEYERGFDHFPRVWYRKPVGGA